jgi:hypothetical protein
MTDDAGADLDWREIRALRAMASQPVARLRHVTLERLEVILGSPRDDTLRVMERLASRGLATCHRDADDGCVCCASATERGCAVVFSVKARAACGDASLADHRLSAPSSSPK